MTDRASDLSDLIPEDQFDRLLTLLFAEDDSTAVRR